MSRAERTAVLVAVAAVLVVTLVVALLTGPPRRPPASGGGAVTVLTRNLYLGGDITRPVRAVRGQSGQAALVALAHANHELREIVDGTDFPTRARLLAKEIYAVQPDLVGLQEVALWRSGPLQLDQIGRPNATTVNYDFLTILQSALAERGTPYDLVRVQSESDVEAPAFAGSPTAPQSPRDVRLTMRDVILLRQGSSVRVTASGSGQFSRRLDLDLSGVPFSFVRGYAWADVTAGAAELRFVTTHLESQSSDLALAQADELLAGPAASSARPVVVVCDCNSDPGATVVEPGQNTAGAAAYQRLTGAGLQDAWLSRGGPGFTAAFSESVRDPSSSRLNRRLDLVLTRGTTAAPVQAERADVLGEEASDRDEATGLWPSDHAGVMTEVRVD
jgi:endonuclease/exonuclease/phosphatase family metal-dependent hydrolase